MLESVKAKIEAAKIGGLAELLTDPAYLNRSLSALAKAIGDSEEATAARIAAEFPHVTRTVGGQSGKVYYRFVQ